MMMLFRRLVVGAWVLAAATPASAHGPGESPGHSMGGGRAGDAASATRTIEIVATDNAFSLRSLSVKDGETVRFVVRNEGFEAHEFLIGTATEHAGHLAMMKEMVERQKKGARAMAMPHHDNGVMVHPGETATFVWTFARTVNLQFACDVPGHYEDGMHGPVSFGGVR
jgi:uncharacterized cupredoxin-like copper-binding protein